SRMPMPVRRPCQCGPLGTGGQGIVLCRRSALVQRDAWIARTRGCAAPRRSWRRGNHFWQRLALRQERLKLLIAYSTLAQIGYLFLMFPLAFNAASARLESGGALAGGLLQTISHASAKAAMFMSAGLIYAALGHDRIAGLAGIGRALPMSVLAFALAGVALIGLPPSGAYLAKELLLQAASGTGQWWWAVAIQAGGILTSSYVVLVLAHALAPADEPVTPRARIARMGEAAALALALCSLLLGLIPWQEYLPVPPGAPFTPTVLQALSSI